MPTLPTGTVDLRAPAGIFAHTRALRRKHAPSAMSGVGDDPRALLLEYVAQRVEVADVVGCH